jgi:pimeloyl-ACP methyl ester carboxylesterase
METEIFQIEGVHSPVLVGGQSSAKSAVLCIHGNPGNNEEFRSLGNELSGSARVLIPDMPGFAGADRPEDFDHSTDGYCAFITGLLDKAGIDDVHLVMHDLGVPWGMTWAAKNPERVRSIVMTGGPVVSNYKWHFLAVLWRLPIVGELFFMLNNRPATKLLMKRGSPRSYPPNFVDDIYDRIDKPMTDAVLKIYRSLDPETFGRAIEEGFSGRDIPSLILWGAHDPYVNKRYAKLAKERVLPSAKVVIFEDSGHWPHVDNPERYNAEVLDFLRMQIGNK